MVRLSFYEMSRVGESITETGRSLVASLVARSGGSGMGRDADGESESEVTQSCRTVCDPMDCSLPGFSIHGFFFSGKSTGVGCRFLLQGTFLTQGWKLRLLLLLRWQMGSYH